MNYQLYLDTPDLAVLLLNLDRRNFRRRALKVMNREVLTRVQTERPGAIVVGFRLGAYPLIPMALASTGAAVSMIVGGEPLAEIGQQMGQEFMPKLSRDTRYISSLDRNVLTTARADLDDGRLVCTLLEMSPIKYAKTTPVKFLGWDIDVAYGIPYLAAMTQRAIVPLVMTRESGPRFQMRFLEPILPPKTERSAIFKTTQDLWAALERQVLSYPELWVGWTRLGSHLGIDVSAPAADPVLAPS